MAIVEAKKSDPASADEVFENIFVGNKAAAEDTQFLLRLTNQLCFKFSYNSYFVDVGKESLTFSTWLQTGR